MEKRALEQLWDQNQNTGKKRKLAVTVYEILFALVAFSNLCLVVFDASYLWKIPYVRMTFRDVYLDHAPKLVEKYDDYKGIEPHRFTVGYNDEVAKLKEALATLSQEPNNLAARQTSIQSRQALVEMSEEQLQLYEQRRLFYRDAVQQQIASAGINQSRFFILQALSELRQLASVPESQTEGQVLSPKREALMEHLSDTIANGHKALVFCNFLASLELIGEQLEEMGIDYVSMSGATRDRQSLVNRFQEDPACKAFLMTLKTGGTGLNLTAADTIFIYDPWWNIAAEQQAIDRAHRIGQTSKVLAYRLITQGSIEEKIQELQERKRALFDQVIGADAGALKALSEDDIDYILS